MKQSFIHLGCWGELKNEEYNKNPVYHVLHTIQNETNTDFIVFAGDNYYPKKIEHNDVKYKIHNKNKIKTLMSHISKIPIHKYILYGNHEITDYTYDITHGISNSGQYCASMNISLQYQNNDMTFFKNVISETRYEDTIILMIDTTSFETKKNENTQCYKQNDILNGLPHFKYNRIIQLMQIITLLNKFKNRKNIIFIGHHPLHTSYNKKINVQHTLLIELFRDINVFVNNRLDSSNVFYLCADTHLYEKSHVIIDNMKIHQYIVGTGGTTLDNIIDEKMYQNDNYTIIEQVKRHGYLKCILKNKEWVFTFIPVINTPTYGGTYKIKKLKTKQKTKRKHK